MARRPGRAAREPERMTGPVGEPRREVRRHQVAMSLEAVAGAWARTGGAAPGSVIVVEQEVAGRVRGGVPWESPGGGTGLQLAMIVQPALALRSERLLWLAASLAVAKAVATVTGMETSTIWPDQVIVAGAPSAVALVNARAQLGPGRIDHAILAVRARFDGIGADVDRASAELEVMAQLDAAMAEVEADPGQLLASYTETSGLVGRRVRVDLLPRGEARGEVIAFDPEGQLVLRSPTDMLERVSPAVLRQLEVISH